MDFSSYVQPTNPHQNASLITGHRFLSLLALVPFTGTLSVEHPVNAAETFTPEYNPLETAEAAGILADPSTILGQRQRSAFEAPNAPDSLKSQGLPQDLPVFLYADVKFEPEDTPVRLNVGEQMSKFDSAIASGSNFHAAYSVLITDACFGLRKEGRDLNAMVIAGEVIAQVPGVNDLVLKAIPAAKA